MFLEVEILEKSPDVLYLPEKKRSIVKLQKEEITVKAGTISVNTKIQCIAKSIQEGKLLLSTATAARLSLPTNVKFQALLKQEANTIIVGPFLGFLITRNKRLRRLPFTTQRYLLEIFFRRALKNGITPLAFTPQDIDWERNTVSGFTIEIRPDDSLKWYKQTFPLPNVIYNRILNRSVEHKDNVFQAIQKIKKISDINFFNPRFLNKWETHTVLSGNQVMRPYLPETLPLTPLEGLVNFLTKHSIVYLKPINGSLGKNIIKLQSTDKGYQFNYRQKKKNMTGVWVDSQKMLTELGKITGNRKYIMQQGLDLKKFNGRVFDLRLLLQKGGSGHWEPGTVVARIAPEGGLFPNIAAGGEAKDIHETWSKLASENWENSQTRQGVLNIGKFVCETLEREMGNFAELGLDIGVDTNGRVWLIEVNSKPSRKVFPKDYPKLKQMSIQNVIDYAKFLSGFSISYNSAGDCDATQVHKS